MALWATSLMTLGMGLVLFFAGFTALETILPALVSIFAPTSLRGTAMGIFSLRAVSWGVLRRIGGR